MRHIVTGILVLAVVAAALPALASNHPDKHAWGVEAGVVVGTDHPPTTTFALTSAGAPAKRGNYKAVPEPPIAKELEVSGVQGGNQ